MLCNLGGRVCFREAKVTNLTGTPILLWLKFGVFFWAYHVTWVFLWAMSAFSLSGVDLFPFVLFPVFSHFLERDAERLRKLPLKLWICPGTSFAWGCMSTKLVQKVFSKYQSPTDPAKSLRSKKGPWLNPEVHLGRSRGGFARRREVLELQTACCFGMAQNVVFS